MARRTRETTDFEDLKPYFEAIGKVVVATNFLTKSEGLLFVALGGTQEEWNKIDDDRGRLKILKKQIDFRFFSTDEGSEHPNVHPALTHMVNEAHRVLHARNRYIHSPYVINHAMSLGVLQLIPDARTGDRHATELVKEEDIIEAMLDFEDHTLALHQHVTHTAQAIGHSPSYIRPWVSPSVLVE